MQGEAPMLAMWEGALGRRGAQREQVLLDAAPCSLPERNLLALRRYAQLFGPAVELVGRCAHCGATVEFTIDAGQCAGTLAQDAPGNAAGETQWHELEAEDSATLRFRLPLPADLHALDAFDDPDAFATALLARCVDGGAPASAETRDAISRRMETLLSGALLSFALHCPDCGGAWNAPLDPVELLWRELRLRAERLLSDIAALARGFGWSERDILELGPLRRAAYLQLLAT